MMLDKKSRFFYPIYVVFGLVFGIILYRSSLGGLGKGYVANSSRHSASNELDGCYHIYLDCGSNRGVQVRKLYQPDLYPKAAINKIFHNEFGDVHSRKPVCSVGFEPNNNHTQYLKDMENAYNRCGHRAIFKVPAGVADFDGTADYFSDNKAALFESGGGIIANRTSSITNKGAVQTIRLARYIKEVVNTRITGATVNEMLQDPPKVLMKLDIEGSEKDVIIDLVFSGTLDVVDFAFIEYHDRKFTDPIERQKMVDSRMIVNTLSKYTKFRISSLDDETYHLTDFPLPAC
ncbi:hypothetical protein SARC_12155 [Sphaeroforma arctica JP610]|uniref:Methyltransferase FkbM domain-containing protein n=1 Tax=Sphaeroforma arctica JP610 TaxID=667725 RepID=A0A0L0FGZ3_9EUKA|nr:hypothetical protein SARC_12155 [Sphaeroforma arctica JP610]KNC75318.1 hypothetical protein SARC_12155 [Sphaeroforma arctica JP610]|eukprot:XP_014149220.1 hypothetical protein SARC_12155 [Sphaeroforma arctica JP610]